MKFKKTLALLAFVTALVAPVSLVGCASTWWAQFQANPIEQTQAFEQGVQVALDTADVVWNSVKSFLPSDVQVTAQAKYDQAILAVNKGLVALTDLVQAAVAAKSPTPDFSTAIVAITDAVSQILAIIDEFKAKPAPAALAASKPILPTGYTDLQLAIVSMKHVGHVK